MKITIDLSEEVNKKLKVIAVQDERSLAKCIARFLTKCVSDDQLVASYLGNDDSINMDITLKQLQSLGVKDFKFQKEENEEEKKLRQLRLEQKLAQIDQSNHDKRAKFLKNKIKEIDPGSDLYEFLEERNLVDHVLNTYPTDEAIIKYIEGVKAEEKEAEEEEKIDNPNKRPEKYPYEREITDFESDLSQPLSPYYLKIKQFCIDNEYTSTFKYMLEVPDYDCWQQAEDGEPIAIICSALGTEEKYLTQNDKDEIVSYFTPHNN